MLLWICHRHKGVAVACFSAGLAATILVGSAAVKIARYQPPVVVRYCDLGDIAKRRPELFKGVSDMPDTSKATTKLEMQEAILAEGEAWKDEARIARAKAAIKKLGGKVPPTTKQKPASTTTKLKGRDIDA